MLGRVVLAFALCLSAFAENNEVQADGTKILVETGRTSDEAAKLVAESLKNVSKSLAAVIALDGKYYAGRFTLTILKNMEGDKREAVRDMIVRFKTAVSKINRSQNIPTLDQIFQNRQLRTSLQTVADRAVEDMTNLHANRWNSDHHTRNRISFVGQFVARLEWVVNDMANRRQINADAYRDFTAEVTTLRGHLATSAELLQKFHDAYLADGHYAGSDHLTWFDDAKSTLLKGEVKLGLYVYNVAGDIVGYLPYEGEFLNLRAKVETKATPPAVKPAQPEVLPTPPPVKKEVPLPPKPMPPPAAPTSEDKVAAL